MYSLDTQNNAFSRVGAKIWNEMLNSFKKRKKKTFRKKLKGALLNILKTEDNYVDNDKIMTNLKKILTYISSLYSYIIYIYI